MKACHFIREDRKLGYKDKRIVKIGRTYKVPKNRSLALCTYGLHASKRPIDALMYAPGSVICRVEMKGGILHDINKLVAYERRVIFMLDITKILHEFACWCAEEALKLIKNPDPRSVAAIHAKRSWLKGKITDKELAAARDAALAAAWAVARAAALIAARDAAWEKQNRKLTGMILKTK